MNSSNSSSEVRQWMSHTNICLLKSESKKRIVRYLPSSSELPELLSSCLCCSAPSIGSQIFSRVSSAEVVGVTTCSCLDCFNPMVTDRLLRCLVGCLFDSFVWFMRAKRFLDFFSILRSTIFSC